MDVVESSREVANGKQLNKYMFFLQIDMMLSVMEFVHVDMVMYN